MIWPVNIYIPRQERKHQLSIYPAFGETSTRYSFPKVTPKHRHQSGLTLIELIISMVIIAIALAGILSVMNLTVRHSADPVVEHQAIAIAEAYLEEIQLQAFNDPDGTNTGETRATYDNVADYNGLNEVPRDQNGSAIAALAAYSVSVAISDQTVSTMPAKVITVTVSGPGVAGLALVGYKF